MKEIDHHYHQLPDFIKSEIAEHTGSLQGLPVVQIVDRYVAAAGHWIAKKNSHYRYNPDSSGFFGNGPLSKQEMEKLIGLLAPKGPIGRANLMLKGWHSRFTAESIRYLTEFRNSLLPIQARLHAEESARLHAQRQAEEAARQLAQRKADEAARLRAQRQAVEEAARQHALRQAEQAARQLALQQAKEAAIRLIRPRVQQVALQQILDRTRENAAIYNNESVGPIRLVPGPKALDEVKNAATRLKTELQTAIADFSTVTSKDKNIPVSDAFSAMLYVFKQTGVDVQKSVAG